MSRAPNPDNTATIEKVRSVIFGMLHDNYDIPEERFERIWGGVVATGVLDRLIEAKKGEDLTGYTLEQLEKMVSDDLKKNNRLALEMTKRPNFNRDLVMELFNGLGVVIKLGREGAYGKGIILKRSLNLQQFYTDSRVSMLMKKLLHINEFARVYDPTCGTGRLFYHLPNAKMCHGVELESDAYNIAKVLFPDAQIIQDTTMSHMHDDTFDYVVANPPFTFYWDDTNHLYKNTGYKNKIVSEMAVLESGIRSLKNRGGVMAVVMPADVWITKFIDKLDFIDWMKGQVTPLAKIELPTHTHQGTVFPTALYVFYKRSGYQDHWAERTPDYPFREQLKSFEDDVIETILQKFSKLGEDYQNICDIADGIKPQEPFHLEIVPVKHMDIADYLKTSIEIVTNDIVQLDAEIPEIGSFETAPLTFIPNGLHADLKVNAIRAFYGIRWSPSRKGNVDVFRENVAKLDAFLDERQKYDALPLILRLHTYDCEVQHTEKFKEALKKRKDWIDFQNAPFEIWVDEAGDGSWKELYADQGYKAAYPEVWNKWVARFEAMQNDPLYNTMIPAVNRTENWLKHLFEFQKNDVVRLALKASSIIAAQMGLGKTRECIAAALLKGFDRNLIVVPTRLIDTWLDEFKQLNLRAPILIRYDDDVNDFLNGDNKFAVISLETLKFDSHTRPRPHGKRAVQNPDMPAANYDVPSVFDREADMRDTMDSMGFEADDVEMIMLSRQPYAENPTKKEDIEEETKEMIRLKALQTKPMYADKLTGNLDLVIVDEAHNLQNPLTDQSQCVARLHSKQYIFMTGTPIKNRVKGLLSLVTIGWGEETTANPYNKKTFLEQFTQYKDIAVEYADSHGFIRSQTREIEIPAIANPDDLRTLMAPKWLRRTKYEPEVAADRKFPKPAVNWINLKPSDAERNYAKQWYDEYLRIKKEIQAAKEELKGLKERRQYLSGDELKKLDDIAAELRTKLAIAGLIIGKLRAVAIAPQINWLTIHTKQHGLEEGDEADEEKLPPMQRLIHIEHPYRGGITPRQERIIEEIVHHVKKQGEQAYTIVSFPEFNRMVLKPELEKRGVRCDIIDGTIAMERRNGILERFRKKEFDVILATIGTFDIGINIPDASYCCFINPEWNWSDMEQAYNRMIRPASKGERVVDIFFTSEGIEKYVQQLAEMKRFNTEYVIDYGPRPPDAPWTKWSDAVHAMFNDMVKGEFSV